MNSSKQISLLQSEPKGNTSSPFDIKPIRKTSMLSLVFFTMLFISKVTSSADTSIIISSRYRLDLHITSKQLGYFGLFTAIGRAIGSLFYSFMFKRDFVKQFLFIQQAIKAGCFLLSFLKLNFTFILISRFLFGMSQMFEMLFYPEWVEDYFEHRVWLTFLMQIATPLGFVFGFLVSFNLEAYSWRKYFLLFFLVSLCSFAAELFSSFRFYRRFQHNRKKSDEILQEVGATINKKEFKAMNKVLEPILLLSLAGRTMLVLVFSFVQFWLNDYMTHVLVISNIRTIFITFTVLCFICPILGNLLENYISLSVIEKEKHLIIIMLASSVLISLMSALVPFVNGVNAFALFIWVYFTLASALISILTSVASKGSDQSPSNPAKDVFCNGIINVFGSGLGILLYGLLKESFSSKLPMRILINFSWFALICVCGIAYMKWDSPEINYPVHIDSPEAQTNPLRLTRTSDIAKGRDIDNADNIHDAISIADDDDNMSKNDEDLFSISFHLQNQSFMSNKSLDISKR